MKDLQIIQRNVKLLLTKYPNLRSLKTRRMAIYKYWQNYEGVGEFGISKGKWLTLTNPETISRAIRKIQQENPALKPSINDQIQQYEKANEFREFYQPKVVLDN